MIAKESEKMVKTSTTPHNEMRRFFTVFSQMIWYDKK